MRLIDADALKAKLEKIADMNNPKWSYDSMMIAKIMINILDEAPTAKDHICGLWITKKAWHVECSECHYVLESICEVKKYCPNCGAKMDGEPE